MRREWMYLDAFRQPQGPVSDSALARMLRRSDAYVWTEGIPGWVMASELFASDLVEPLRGDTPLDPDAQPLSRGFNAGRRADRAVEHLLGLARGLIADGVLVDAEIHALQGWLDANREELGVWPLNVLAERMDRIMADGRIEEEERAELMGLLQRFVGEEPATPVAMNRATRLPLDDPEPQIQFVGKTFLFTGKFAYGTRSACENAVIERGAACAGNVTKKVDVLVVGVIGSADWAHSTHGRKIEQAVKYRESGLPLAIVSEEHWAAAL